MEHGGWHAVKKLRRPVPVKHAAVQNLDGEMVSTAERADALADYFEQVQWRNPLPDAELLDRPCLGNELPIMLSAFTLAELQTVLSKLKRADLQVLMIFHQTFGLQLRTTTMLVWLYWHYANNVGTKKIFQRRGDVQRWYYYSKKATLHCHKIIAPSRY